MIAAGGTGGHVFPAIAIADEIKEMKPESEILFMGTKGKIEARAVPQKGYNIGFIWISGLHRSLRMDNLLFPIKVITALFQSFFAVRKFRPDVVIGTGGYVCGPVLYAASLLGCPIFLHESNSLPGVTTRILSRRAAAVFTAFETTARWLKRKDNISMVGTPTRSSLHSANRDQGAGFFQLDPAKKTVLVFGGSLGAASINSAVDGMVKDITGSGYQLIWQTGVYGSFFAEKWKNESGCRIYQFIDNMEYAYAAADVVICRSGATTAAELTGLGKTAILIPYPHAAEDHQTVNARTLADAGAAVMIKDGETGMKLKDELFRLLNDDDRRLRIGRACLEFGRPEAGKKIAQKVFEYLN
jgi:UDP-N-acetylglucosamine--N-acetylmuramyl-(pentapeptide) pyrophosphoryl-undecaprenol N-acetylglucosamine transferase